MHCKSNLILFVKMGDKNLPEKLKTIKRTISCKNKLLESLIEKAFATFLATRKYILSVWVLEMMVTQLSCSVENCKHYSLRPRQRQQCTRRELRFIRKAFDTIDHQFS